MLAGGSRRVPVPADRLSGYRVADGIQDIDEVARRADLTEQSHPREHLDLIFGYIVEAAQLRVPAEFSPGRFARSSRVRRQEHLRVLIGEQEEFAPVEAQRLCEADERLVGRTPFSGFQMTDERCRGVDALSQLVLGQIKLAPSLANDLAEMPFRGVCHRI